MPDYTASRLRLAQSLLDVMLNLSKQGLSELSSQLLETIKTILAPASQKRGAVQVCGEIRDALGKAGLPCPWSIKGWEIESKTKFRSMRFNDSISVRRDNTSLVWTIGIDGSIAGVKFLPYRHSDLDGKQKVQHKPENAETLCAPIKRVFDGLGFSTLDVIATDYNPYENFIIIYTVTTNWPDFLGEF